MKPFERTQTAHLKKHSHWLTMKCSMLSLVRLVFLSLCTVPFRTSSCSDIRSFRDKISSCMHCSYKHKEFDLMKESLSEADEVETQNVVFFPPSSGCGWRDRCWEELLSRTSSAELLPPPGSASESWCSTESSLTQRSPEPRGRSKSVWSVWGFFVNSSPNLEFGNEPALCSLSLCPPAAVERARPARWSPCAGRDSGPPAPAAAERWSRPRGQRRGDRCGLRTTRPVPPLPVQSVDQEGLREEIFIHVFSCKTERVKFKTGSLCSSRQI